MSTYVIGDVHGCLDPLVRLLEKIQYEPTHDVLWFTGDLVNRGPHSLETLRFIKALPASTILVLGNHDVTLLAVADDKIPYSPKHHSFSDILEAPDRIELMEWLRHHPLIHHDAHLGYTLIHAGLAPQWDLSLALSLAKEVEQVIQGPGVHTFFAGLYGDKPDRWDPNLQGQDRLRFIFNCFVRLRFCSPEGQLALHAKGSIEEQPAGCCPWFAVPNRLSQDLKILFGHWSCLKGASNVPNVFALDTGCVWGGCLTALRLEDEVRFTVGC